MDRRQFAKTLLGAALVPLVVRPGAATEAAAHPVFLPEIAAAQAHALRKRLSIVMALSDSRLLERIPTRTGFIACDCPNCDQGVQGDQLQWRLEEPAVLTCRYCGQRYPTPKYPDDKVIEVKDPLGRTQQYPYYQDASGLKYFFQARLWREARDYFMLAAYDLAQVYHFTREPLLAHQAALILERFAQLYPGFIVVRESSQKDQGFQEHPPYETQGGKWGRWYYDEMPTPLVRAYDLIYASGELEEVGQERGADAKRRIEEDFFRAAVRHVRLYPELYTNASPAIYEGLAVLGRVIAEADYVHDAVRRMTGLFENSFMFDGFWGEGSANYHIMTMRGVQAAIEAVTNYSDPPGYVDPTDRAHFANLDPRERIPMLSRAQATTARFCYPDGRLLPVHESWSPSIAPTTNAVNAADRPLRGRVQPLASSAPALWPAAGHCYLGRGRGADQMQVHLHFSGGYGHAHNDNLNLALFALGEELLPDLGYTHSRYRYWTRSTLAHNTVLVNGHEQYSGTKGLQYSGPGISFPPRDMGPSDGNLLLFQAAGEDFQIAEASGERGYPGLVQTYRRCVILVGIDAKSAYIVDLFKVVGGERQEWALHGSADRDQVLTVDTALPKRQDSLLESGVRFTPPTMEYEAGVAGDQNPAYGFVRDLRRGPAPPVLMATFSPASGPGPQLRVHSLPPSGAEVFAGRAPSVRRAEENDAAVDQFWMPLLLVRKEGRSLSETFVSVLEPFAAKPAIQGVARMNVSDGGIGLRISGEEWTDYIVYCEQEGEVISDQSDQLKLAGRIGWVRERVGRVDSMCLVGGTELNFGKQKLTSFGTRTGRMTGVLRAAAGQGVDAFAVGEDIPAVELVGKTAVVRHGDGSTHGYRLTGVQRERGRTLLLLAGEPGFEIREGKSRFLFFPKHEVAGEVTYTIADIVFRRDT